MQVSSWGGYSFIINLVPIHCLACIFTGRLTSKLYVAYSPFVIIGTIEAGESSCFCPLLDAYTVYTPSGEPCK